MAYKDIDYSALMNDIRNEAGTRNTEVDKKNFPVTYEFVRKEAERLGVDIEKEGFKIHLTPWSEDRVSSYNNNAEIDVNNKTITIGQSILHGISKDPRLSAEALRGVIGHEIQHYIDHKSKSHAEPEGLWEKIKKLNPFGDKNASHKASECRADFANPGNEGLMELNSKNVVKNFNDGGITHPLDSDRLRSLMIQSYIKEKTGVTLTPQDVEHNGSCEFKIINKEKLDKIPPNVLTDARDLAEHDVKILKGVVHYNRKKMDAILGGEVDQDGKTPAPSAPLLPQALPARKAESGRAH